MLIYFLNKILELKIKLQNFIRYNIKMGKNSSYKLFYFQIFLVKLMLAQTHYEKRI